MAGVVYIQMLKTSKRKSSDPEDLGKCLHTQSVRALSSAGDQNKYFSAKTIKRKK